MAQVHLPEFVGREGRGDPDPYDNLSWLRSTMPIGTVVGPDGEGTVWFVTDYEHGRACLSDPRLSHDRRNCANPGDFEPDQGDLLGKDPPDHSRLRRLVSPLLSPGASERLRPKVIKICADLIDEFVHTGEAELVGQFAWPIPWAVIHEFFGVPDAERMEVSHCIDRFLVAGYAEQQRGGGPATQELMDYIRHIVAYKRRNRGDDVTTVMIEGLEQGIVRTEAELEGMLYVLLGAGQVSTGPMIAAGILRLLENPDELTKLLNGDVEWKVAVEEALRYDSPVQTSVSRYALTDLRLGDVAIAKGDTAVISLAAANRDPQHFVDAEQFRVDQWRSHVAFGHGIHLCVGAPLARLEGEVALEMIFRRLSNMRLTTPLGDSAWVLAPKLRSPREVRVRFDVP